MVLEPIALFFFAFISLKRGRNSVLIVMCPIAYTTSSIRALVLTFRMLSIRFAGIVKCKSVRNTMLFGSWKNQNQVVCSIVVETS